MPKLIFERAIHVNDQGELYSYWPEQWPIEKLAKKWRALTSGPFAAGYQNDPNALSGNALERDWLQIYTEAELAAHRERLGVTRGTLHAGADPTRGGSGRDPDFFACITGERLENRCYLQDFFNERLGIDVQAQYLEDWLDVRGGIASGCIEDSSEKGYVWNDLKQVNGGAGTQYAWEVEKAQGKNAVGAKELRFLAMAPRFKNGQVLIPGFIDASGVRRIHPKWDIFVQEWCAFPSGHDDLLDAAHWLLVAVFGKPAPIGATKGTTPRQHVAGVCERRAHLAYGQPIDKCSRCMSELEANRSLGRDAKGSQAPPTIGSHHYTRTRVGIFRR